MWSLEGFNHPSYVHYSMSKKPTHPPLNSALSGPAILLPKRLLVAYPCSLLHDSWWLIHPPLNTTFGTTTALPSPRLFLTLPALTSICILEYWYDPSPNPTKLGILKVHPSNIRHWFLEYCKQYLRNIKCLSMINQASKYKFLNLRIQF